MLVVGYSPEVDEVRQPLRLAAKCAFLRVTMGERAGGHLVNLCLHIVREGRECVGPFLDDHETACGLWEGPRRGESSRDFASERESGRSPAG